MADNVFVHSSERLQLLIDALNHDDKLREQDLPGLSELFSDIVNPDVDVTREDSVRGFLKVFWKSTTDGTYSSILDQYTVEEKDRIKAFVEEEKPASDAGKGFSIGLSLGAREELPVIDDDDSSDDNESILEKIRDFAEDARDRIKASLGQGAIIYDDQKHQNKVYAYFDKEFQNWGRTVQNIPHLTYVPRTSYGVQQIVKYARAKGMNVRASGYRHSWSPVFGKNGQILISTLGLHRASALPNIESLPGSQIFAPHTELSAIEFVGVPQPGKKRLVRVGTAVTNQMLRRWCNDQDVDHASTLPLNVIMVEITIGGSNAPICHGAGRRHPTLSDLVYAIEYVDANGNLQKLSKDEDPNFMNVASGCFGLLGVVTHITLELDPMSYAVMIPRKLPVMQAIPPPPGWKDEDIPEPLRIFMTPEERAKAQAEFEDRARNDFYSEWFWFPYTSKVWVNCWNTVEDGVGAQNYPSSVEVFIQWAETVAINIIQRSEAFFDLQKLFPWAQATVISKLGLYAMPDITDPSQAIKTKLPNALHFRRAIQNVRVRDMEFEIPLLPKNGSLKNAKFGDEIDWSTAQQAWWDAIREAYRNTETCPQRMPLEMRITGTSQVTMSPYRGHPLGTCSIEILTLENMGPEWLPYAQKVLDRWMALKDKDGNYLPTRPHWAKEWYPLKVRGAPMVQYLKDQYADALVEFGDIFGQIAAKQGWTVAQARERFSNETFDQFFFDQAAGKNVAPISAKVASQVQTSVAEIHPGHG